jgi:hypothetical protein
MRQSGKFCFSVADHHHFCFTLPLHSPSPLTPAMAKDHTKSLLPYRAILTGVEQEYRDTALADRGDLVAKIMEAIKQAAARERAEIADDETVTSVCALLSTSGFEFN